MHGEVSPKVLVEVRNFHRNLTLNFLENSGIHKL
jgi:hypothetical protein